MQHWCRLTTASDQSKATFSHFCCFFATVIPIRAQAKSTAHLADCKIHWLSHQCPVKNVSVPLSMLKLENYLTLPVQHLLQEESMQKSITDLAGHFCRERHGLPTKSILHKHRKIISVPWWQFDGIWPPCLIIRLIRFAVQVRCIAKTHQVPSRQAQQYWQHIDKIEIFWSVPIIRHAWHLSKRGVHPAQCQQRCRPCWYYTISCNRLNTFAEQHHKSMDYTVQSYSGCIHPSIQCNLPSAQLLLLLRQLANDWRVHCTQKKSRRFPYVSQ